MSTTSLCFFTVGYGRWPAAQRAEKLQAALKAAGVDVLVDIRHSPCSASLSPKSNYRPTDMNLQPSGEGGIVAVAAAAGCEYLWLVQLGNPQKNDPAMTVFREHLAAPRERDWPARLGLGVVKAMVSNGERVALMCACKEYERCHRKLVAEALLAKLPAGTEHRDLKG